MRTARVPEQNGNCFRLPDVVVGNYARLTVGYAGLRAFQTSSEGQRRAHSSVTYS